MKLLMITLSVVALATCATASLAEEKEIEGAIPDVELEIPEIDIDSSEIDTEIPSDEVEDDDRHHHDWRAKLRRGAGKIRDAINAAIGRVPVPNHSAPRHAWSWSNATAHFVIAAPRVGVRIVGSQVAIIGSRHLAGTCAGNYQKRGGRRTPFRCYGKLSFMQLFRVRQAGRRVEVSALPAVSAFSVSYIYPDVPSRDFSGTLGVTTAQAFDQIAGKAALAVIKKIVNS